MSFHKILIVGNVSTEPEVRYAPTGKPQTSFCVTTTRRYRLADQTKEESENFKVVTFGRLAEIATEFLSKGKCIFLEGRMRRRTWEDREGKKHHRTEVVAEALRSISRK